MSVGDITYLDNSVIQGVGALTFNVAANTTAINAGEPVTCPLGAVQAAIPMATNQPVVGTTYVAGIAATSCPNNATLTSTVTCYPVDEKAVLLIAPNVAATWNTQAKYDLLVGSRVLMDLTSGVYTILATDGSTSGCVVRPLNISLYPGKVAFSFRAASSYVA